MDNSIIKSIDINYTTSRGEVYKGIFEVKTELTRSDVFRADQIRRQIIGPSPQDALPILQTEAYILGQLSVRILSGPKWWENSNQGLDLSDNEIIFHIYDKILALLKEEDQKIDQETKQLQDELKRKNKKAITE